MSQRNGNVCWFVCGCRTFFVDEPAVDGYTIGEGQVLQFQSGYIDFTETGQAVRPFVVNGRWDIPNVVVLLPGSLAKL